MNNSKDIYKNIFLAATFLYFIVLAFLLTEPPLDVLFVNVGIVLGVVWTYILKRYTADDTYAYVGYLVGTLAALIILGVVTEKLLFCGNDGFCGIGIPIYIILTIKFSFIGTLLALFFYQFALTKLVLRSIRPQFALLLAGMGMLVLDLIIAGVTQNEDLGYSLGVSIWAGQMMVWFVDYSVKKSQITTQ